MKLELAADEPVFDHPQIGVRAQAAAHLGEPAFGLPRRDRRVAPEEQHAVASAQVGSNLGLLHAAAVQLFEQRALTRETGIGRGQPDADLARRRRDHLIPQPATERSLT